MQPLTLMHMDNCTGYTLKITCNYKKEECIKKHADWHMYLSNYNNTLQNIQTLGIRFHANFSNNQLKDQTAITHVQIRIRRIGLIPQLYLTVLKSCFLKGKPAGMHLTIIAVTLQIVKNPQKQNGYNNYLNQYSLDLQMRMTLA